MVIIDRSMGARAFLTKHSMEHYKAHHPYQSFPKRFRFSKQRAGIAEEAERAALTLTPNPNPNPNPNPDPDRDPDRDPDLTRCLDRCFPSMRPPRPTRAPSRARLQTESGGHSHQGPLPKQGQTQAPSRDTQVAETRTLTLTLALALALALALTSYCSGEPTMGATVAPPNLPGRMAELPHAWSYEGLRWGSRPRCTGRESEIAFSSSMQSIARVPSR